MDHFDFSLSFLFNWFVSLYFIIVAILYVSIRLCHEKVWRRKEIVTDPDNRTLVVIAHPDDETMFFGPTILALLKRGPLYILCISHGDYELKGFIRKPELWNSCQTLGIPTENITLIKHDKLKDNPYVKWPIPHLANTIFNHVMSHQITTLVTFDAYGVSGHLNHIAIYKAVIDLIERNRFPSSCRVFTLNSVNLCRKYLMGLVDIPLCYLFNKYVFVANGKARGVIGNAMECHKTQLVWFRRLYLIFSRYLLINTLNEVSYPRPKIHKPNDALQYRIKDD